MINRRKTFFASLSAALVAAATLAHAAAGDNQRQAVPADILGTAAMLQKQAAGDATAAAIARSLTTEVGPRFAGTSGDSAAIGWALNELKTLGLSNVHAEAVTVPQWVRGTARLDITGPDPHRLAAAALAGSVGTGDDGIEAPVIQVATVPALRNLNDDDVNGKIVYLSARVQRSADGSGYRALLPNLRHGAAVAAQKGAVAVVIRSLGTDWNRLPHTGWTQFPAPNLAIPALAISNPDADLLDIELSKGAPVTLRVRSTARMLPPARSANVIGDIPGQNRNGEIVLLGAHLDSWDLGAGALDDAAGVAAVLSAARLISQMARKRSRRTVRVVLFANAEFGGSGAAAYAARHAGDLDHVVLALDAICGGLPIWRFDTGAGPAAAAPLAAISQALARLNIERGPNGFSGDVDTQPLFNHGVPVVRLLPDLRRYYDFAATANDTPDKINHTALKQNVAAYATVAYLAAALPADFGRAPASFEAPATPVPAAPRRRLPVPQTRVQVPATTPPAVAPNGKTTDKAATDTN